MLGDQDARVGIAEQDPRPDADIAGLLGGGEGLNRVYVEARVLVQALHEDAVAGFGVARDEGGAIDAAPRGRGEHGDRRLDLDRAVLPAGQPAQKGEYV